MSSFKFGQKEIVSKNIYKKIQATDIREVNIN